MGNYLFFRKKKDFNQVCIWPGTIVEENQIQEFEDWFKKQGYRIQFLESIRTDPDRDETGAKVPGTGGRTDLVFAVHDEDVMKFAIPRLQMGIRWIEDVLDNEHLSTTWSVYPERFQQYRTWPDNPPD